MWLYVIRRDYDAAWQDVNNRRSLGGQPDPGVFAALQKATPGRRN
ncbi:MAG: hypothetical protein PHU85_10265 [Phycisphaerae bacterium]|nr:hypothetical protein [Phycisphaerae bacterium]